MRVIPSTMSSGRERPRPSGGALDLGAVLRANARRAQEAVRSLEEYVKLASPDLSGQCKAVRFRLYDVEAELAARVRVLEAAGAHRLGVYVVIDRASAKDMSVADIAASARRCRRRNGAIPGTNAPATVISGDNAESMTEALP